MTDRQRLALELRALGVSYALIGEALGVTGTRARQLTKLAAAHVNHEH